MTAYFTTNLTIRESVTVGFLMSTKGLIAIIVLNVGLSLNIFTVTQFTIMMIMALFTTILTTPVVAMLFPKWMVSLREQGDFPPGSDMSVLLCLDGPDGTALLELAHDWITFKKKVRRYCWFSFPD